MDPPPMKNIPLSTVPVVTATEKRKKRKAMIDAGRSLSVFEDGIRRSSNDFESQRILSDTSVSSAEDTASTPLIFPIKTQSSQIIAENKFLLRYDPAVPMTKEEASAWRKEERRKRNRESAAASRQKTRDRISELEDEVHFWKSKFDEAALRIAKLERLYKTQKEGNALKSVAQPTAEQCQGLLFTPWSVSPFSTPPQTPRLVPTLVSPSSANFPSMFVAGGENDLIMMNEEKHFKEIFQQAKYEILCH